MVFIITRSISPPTCSLYYNFQEAVILVLEHLSSYNNSNSPAIILMSYPFPPISIHIHTITPSRTGQNKFKLLGVLDYFFHFPHLG